jgi:serine/threonine protein kinase
MAPEHFSGRATLQSDIYSMGIVLYQLLTGRVPFSAESDYQLMKSQIEDPPPPPKKYADHLSNQLQATILRALSKSGKDRYANVQQLADALAKCPESRNASQEKLEDLVECMHKKHPINVTPLNQQAFKTLQVDGQVALKSENKRKSHSKFGMEQQKKLLFIWSKRNYLMISFLVLTIGAFVFWLILQNSSKTSKNTPVSGYKERPSSVISDDGFEQKKNNDHQEPPSEQQKEKEWIIKR